MPDGILGASFRDPGGFLYRRNNTLLRQVNVQSEADYRQLMDSGLYGELTDKGLLIPHREVSLDLAVKPGAAVVLEPEPVPFISYSYEWSFSQLRDAALTTLRIQKLALKKSMVLKDASAFNIQFHEGRPLLIDTLSLAAYRPGEPWIAYRQFCQHFLAPLALMARRDIRLGALLRTNIDGIPLDLAAGLLPWRCRLAPGLLMHLYAHAASQKKHAGKPGSGRSVKVSQKALTGIVDSLRGVINGLKWKPEGTEWAGYYDDTNYTDAATEAKKGLVAEYLTRIPESTVWDIGANNGLFSRVASDRGLPVIAFDIDPAAVELNWLRCKSNSDRNLLPLLMDLTNPSPGLGWAHDERASLISRGPAGTVLALALVHHLAISNNVPLDRLAGFLAAVGRYVIIEFVPKSDSQVQRLLATREDVFPDYTENGFEDAFSDRFQMLARETIADSERKLYLFEAGEPPHLKALPNE